MRGIWRKDGVSRSRRETTDKRKSMNAMWVKEISEPGEAGEDQTGMAGSYVEAHMKDLP